MVDLQLWYRISTTIDANILKLFGNIILIVFTPKNTVKTIFFLMILAVRYLI